MIRRIIIFSFIILCASVTAWIADHPGEILIIWNDYRIEASLMAGGGLLLAMTVLLLLSWRIMAFLSSSPQKIKSIFQEKWRSRGYQAVTRGMVAIGSGDIQQAIRHTQKARRIMKNDPLTLLLTAQTAQLQGDQATARRTFEIMLASPETEKLALHGLFLEARQRNDAETAYSIAIRALKLNPKTAWAGRALFEIQCASGAWDEALRSLARNQSNRLTGKNEARRLRAVLLTARAMDGLESDDDAQTGQALKSALEAHGYAPDLVPAAICAGKILLRDGHTRQAIRIIEKTWKLTGHPDLAKLFSDAHAKEPAYQRLKRARAFAALSPDSREAALVLAIAACNAHDWSLARETLEPHMKNSPSQRFCLLMAEIEKAEHDDPRRGHEWLTRAIRAPRDPMWVAHGVTSSTWAPISPVTGKLDAFEWRAPSQEARVTQSTELAGIDAFLPPQKHEKIDANTAPLPAPDTSDEPPARAGRQQVPDPIPEPLADYAGDKETEQKDVKQNTHFSPDAPDNPGPEGLSR